MAAETLLYERLSLAIALHPALVHISVVGYFHVSEESEEPVELDFRRPEQED